jgi:hypothetical protein
MSAVAAVIEEIRKEDPDKLADIEHGLDAGLKAFKAARDKSKN